MRRRLAILGAAALALAGAHALRATAVVEGGVNDPAVLSGTPKTLSAFGFFRAGASHVPNPGIIPYTLNTPLWSDGADKLRFIYLPPGKQLAEGGEGLLRFPVGSAIIKTFAFGEGAARRLIETRVLLHRAEGWVALPYRWNTDQTEATLALAGGRVDLVTPAGEAISYAIPNKNQCKSCHSKDGQVVPIGPQARNLPGEWLKRMSASGLLDRVPQIASSLPDWSSKGEGAAAPRARAYLDVNCAHCHQPGGAASNSGLDLRWEQRDPHSLGVMKRPVAAGRGAGGLLFSIVPGRPDESILLYRMESADPGVAMPELGRSSVDREGVAAVRQWIAEMQ